MVKHSRIGLILLSFALLESYINAYDISEIEYAVSECEEAAHSGNLALYEKACNNATKTYNHHTKMYKDRLTAYLFSALAVGCAALTPIMVMPSISWDKQFWYCFTMAWTVIAGACWLKIHMQKEISKTKIKLDKLKKRFNHSLEIMQTKYHVPLTVHS